MGTVVSGDGPIVADTDYVIDFLRDHGEGAAAVERWLRDGRLRLTAVTAFELRVGGDFARREQGLRPLLEPRTLPMDLQAGLLAGGWFAKLEAAGRGIGVKDCLQAGICLRYGVRLATRNRRHFERIDGLRLVSASV